MSPLFCTECLCCPLPWTEPGGQLSQPRVPLSPCDCSCDRSSQAQACLGSLLLPTQKQTLKPCWPPVKLPAPKAPGSRGFSQKRSPYVKEHIITPRRGQCDRPMSLPVPCPRDSLQLGDRLIRVGAKDVLWAMHVMGHTLDPLFSRREPPCSTLEK